MIGIFRLWRIATIKFNSRAPINAPEQDAAEAPRMLSQSDGLVSGA